MDHSGIPACDKGRSLSRDEGSLIHQRAVILTHQKTLERHQIYLNRGLDLGILILDARGSKEGLGCRKVCRECKRQEKLELERQRKASISADKRAQEKRGRLIEENSSKR